MSETKLKPCPFCGGEVTIALIGDKNTRWFVTRGFGKNKCTCRVFMESEQMPRDASKWTRETIKRELAKKWNTRKPMDNIVAELEKEKDLHTHFYKLSEYKDFPEVKTRHALIMYNLDKAIGIVKKGGVNETNII